MIVLDVTAYKGSCFTEPYVAVMYAGVFDCKISILFTITTFGIGDKIYTFGRLRYVSILCGSVKSR